MNITRFIYDPYCNEMRLDTSGEYVRYADVTLVFQEETKALRAELVVELRHRCVQKCQPHIYFNPIAEQCLKCKTGRRIVELEGKMGV